MISMLTCLALARISVSLSSGDFFVSTIRFSEGMSFAIFSRARTFSALSTKIVFNDAEGNTGTSIDRSGQGIDRRHTLIDDMDNCRFTQRIVQGNVDHAVEMTCQRCAHPLSRTDANAADRLRSPTKLTSTLLMA